ncbi:MAG: PspA-associated protein PspAA [Chloroflexota bacterium]
MIVRISTEGQYRVGSAVLDQLNQLDNRIVEAVARGDEPAFHQLFRELVAYVRGNGEVVPAEELAASDVILPPPDTTLREARRLFAGEGIIPG